MLQLVHIHYAIGWVGWENFTPQFSLRTNNIMSYLNVKEFKIESLFRKGIESIIRPTVTKQLDISNAAMLD